MNRRISLTCKYKNLNAFSHLLTVQFVQNSRNIEAKKLTIFSVLPESHFFENTTAHSQFRRLSSTDATLGTNPKSVLFHLILQSIDASFSSLLPRGFERCAGVEPPPPLPSLYLLRPEASFQ